MPTETKSYTPGAERAAREWCIGTFDIPDLAALISRETGDLKLREQNAEMLEALRELQHAVLTEDGVAITVALFKASAAIDKVEGR